MDRYLQIIIFVAGFAVVAVAASQIARVFQKIRLPLITGLLIVGIICGPFILNLIPEASVGKLVFVNDLALAFIAFAVGSELYLSELRDRIHSITWMTVGQLLVTFLLGSVGVFILISLLPLLHASSLPNRITISLMAGTIFVARSPASAIAIVSELRAKGPFTQTALGVTVLKDFLVIILFALNLSIGETLIYEKEFSLLFIGVILLELGIATGLGILLGKFLSWILSLSIQQTVKTVIILLAGLLTYQLTYFIRDVGEENFLNSLYLEPLLICIIASLVVTNYGNYRAEFLKIITQTGPVIYVVFFTLVGSSIALDYLGGVWLIALLFFIIRFLSVIAGGYVGSFLAGEPKKFHNVSWMPYITQAGVSLGLVTVVSGQFSSWGVEFASIMIAVIFVNQLIGPPLFKYAINRIGESHARAGLPKTDGVPNALIFGLENQSVALARQLMKNGWKVKIASLLKGHNEFENPDLPIVRLRNLKSDARKLFDEEITEAVVLMMSDKKNLGLCELAYEKYGTRDIVVRLNNWENFNVFHEMGAKIVEPSTAIVSLLDHFVRSPQATSLLLGMQENQDTREFEITNPNLHGLTLRKLRLPHDVIILSVTRSGQMVVSHGYTRLRLGDIITLVGSKTSLESIANKF